MHINSAHTSSTEHEGNTNVLWYDALGLTICCCHGFLHESLQMAPCGCVVCHPYFLNVQKEQTIKNAGHRPNHDPLAMAVAICTANKLRRMNRAGRMAPNVCSCPPTRLLSCMLVQLDTPHEWQRDPAPATSGINGAIKVVPPTLRDLEGGLWPKHFFV